jgi:hypothetical protein
MKRWLTIGIVVVIAVGAGAFFGGMAYGQSKPPSAQEAMKVVQNLTPQQQAQLFTSGTGSRGTGPGGTGGFAGRAAGGGLVAGDIIAKDATSITVKMSDGSTKIVLYSGSTTVNVAQAGTANDLVTGKTVTVTGTTNSDGSVTATRIQIGTLGLGGRPGGANDSTSTPSGTTTTT